MTVLFRIGEDVDHHVGDPQCPACWEEYPSPCRCGGLMHAAAGEEDEDGNVLLLTKCDRCGRTEEELGQP